MKVRIGVHFHPDWQHESTTVLAAIAATGSYLPQFATGTSNGGLTAHPGGARWLWESRLFNGRYDRESPTVRPVYGAVDLGDSYGPAPRFGSSWFRLRDDVVARSSFCYPDSALEPSSVVDVHSVDELIGAMRGAKLDELDRYVEAHVHGGVSVHDCAVIVLDPSYRGGHIEEVARALGCAVEFHPGYVLDTRDLNEDFRGLAAVRLAQELATELTPAALGDAARTGEHDRQTLKYVWHLMAKFGRTW